MKKLLLILSHSYTLEHQLRKDFVKGLFFVANVVIWGVGVLTIVGGVANWIGV